MLQWHPTGVEAGKPYYWKIGSLHLWITKSGDEWLLASKQVAGDLDSKEVIVARAQEKPEELLWNRFVFTEESNIIQLIPVLQDRAIVVGSEIPVKILPGGRALFFVNIPVWVRVYTGENRKAILTEIPTVTLSNTWFGDPMSGELCYSLRSHARRSIQNMGVYPQRAVCPIRVKNKSTNQLDFQKLCVHAEHLKVYEGKSRLWTNEVNIDFFGEDEPSEVGFSNTEPTFEEGCKLLCEERIPVDRSLLKKSVSILKYFTRFEY